MMMSHLFSFILLILILRNSQQASVEPNITLPIDPQSILTNPTRTSNVNLYCNGVTRTALISSNQLANADSSHRVLTSIFPADVNNRLLLLGGIVRSSSKDVLAAYGQNIRGFAVTIGLALLGIIILVIISVSMYCHIKKTTYYVGEEEVSDRRLFFTLVGIFCALLAACFAIAVVGKHIFYVGFTAAGNTNTSMAAAVCTVAITFDDVLNGNITSSG